MIKHRPSGYGHPYAPDTEQRFPVVPVQGEPLRLGILAGPATDEVHVEIEELREDGTTFVVALEPVVASVRGGLQDGGHLAAAQARGQRDKGGWSVTLAEPPTGSFRYRFRAVRQTGVEETAWFYALTAKWEDHPQVVTVRGLEETRLAGQILTDGQEIHRVRWSLPLEANEKVVGFGERYDRLDHRGQDIDVRVFEQYKSQGLHRHTYMPMPFAHVVGGRGWGFHVQTSRNLWFDVGQTDPTALRVEAEVRTGTSDLPALVVALYEGSPNAVLDRFLAEVGRPKQLPDWVFRLWASSNEWNTQAEVMRQIALHRQHEIPVGNVVIEAWSDEATFTTFRDAQYRVRLDGRPPRLSDFTFPEDGAWPDPKGMVEELHSQDVRVHLWQIPLQKLRPHPKGQARADADAAVRADVLVREKRGVGGELVPYRNRGWWFPLSFMPDLTDRRAAHWWTERRRYLVDEVGIDGFKTDGGEHAWGDDLVFLNGRDGGEMNNIFPVAYAAAYGNLLERCGKPPVTFSRSGYTGSQAHGAFWAGDENSSWEAFRWSLFAGLSASSSGILYWGWDIAGFSGPPPTADLYVRAMAASVFVPIMQYHSEFNHHRHPSVDRTPWNIAERNEDEAVIDEVRDLVRLREALLPYISQSAQDAIDTGKPLMRPLFFTWPDDPLIWDFPLQWTFGDDLLVAPITTESAEGAVHRAYLPPGEWIDVWSGLPIAGGQVVEGSWPRNRLPVYCRASSWDVLKGCFGHL